MTIIKRLSPILMFTLLLMLWTGYLYALLLVLRLTGEMLPLQVLQRIVFGPAMIMLAGFAIVVAVGARRPRARH